jgi:hypothetical protein
LLIIDKEKLYEGARHVRADQNEEGRFFYAAQSNPFTHK